MGGNRLRRNRVDCQLLRPCHSVQHPPCADQAVSPPDRRADLLRLKRLASGADAGDKNLRIRREAERARAFE